MHNRITSWIVFEASLEAAAKLQLAMPSEFSSPSLRLILR